MFTTPAHSLLMPSFDPAPIQGCGRCIRKSRMAAITITIAACASPGEGESVRTC